jgi:sugar (pentulose or hexulose) kinase
MTKTLIFDIGKTNKKYFIFDEDYSLLESQSVFFSEKTDEDGFPCEDIEKLKEWVLNAFNEISSRLEINFLNFSAYGATVVYLDNSDSVIFPVYNYLKPASNEIVDKFIQMFSDEEQFSFETSSPFLGFLNSGFQIFTKMYSEKFYDVNCIMHLPQYISFLFSVQKNSEFTSLGCHTGMWNYSTKSYHRWIYDCNVSPLLPKFAYSPQVYKKGKMLIGTGIHDSSSALIPYLKISEHEFVLLSTGTWSICLNPTNNDPLSFYELKNDCLNFMTPDGSPVKASRLFIGKELEIQSQIIAEKFNVGEDVLKRCRFNKDIYEGLKNNFSKAFEFQYLKNIKPINININSFADYEVAYHQLLMELVELQIEKIKLIIGNKNKIKVLYIDGGFTSNDIFLNILADNLPEMSIFTSEMAAASALGAALAINYTENKKDILKSKIKLKQISVSP